MHGLNPCAMPYVPRKETEKEGKDEDTWKEWKTLKKKLIIRQRTKNQ